jgi:hypothetical protein
MRSVYRVNLDKEEIGTTLLESGDPPMGVVSGKISFHALISAFNFFLNYCRIHDITVNSTDPEHEFIDTQVIPALRVFRTDGTEIAGQGCCISGFKEEGYEITILGIPYPFYAEEFPLQRRAYDERFRA